MGKCIHRPRRLMLGVVLATILAVWIASAWVLVGWQGDRWFACVATGQATVMSGRVAREPGLGGSLHAAELAWGFDGYWSTGPARSAWGFTIPLWCVWIIAATIGMGKALHGWGRMRRTGRCGCGYPLVGLARCPECGVEAATK